MQHTKNYRSDIDGLRAVAVLSVVLYHFGFPALTGGFVGVDIFFVISGYLITAIVQRELAEGTFTLGGFYRRRVRRILPALLAVVGASVVAGFFLLMPGDYTGLGWQAALSVTGMSNVYFKLRTGYFDQAAEMLPLLHTWSLAIEEQFYLVWPLWLAGASWLAGRRPKITGLAVAGAAAVSFIVAIWWVGTAPVQAFYSPFSRAWELALGALIVFLPILRGRLTSELATLTGALLIGWTVFTLTSSDPFPGLGALAPCLGAALLIWPRERLTLVGRVLSLRPMVLIGLISYSLYLWHWPILVFYRHYNNGLMPNSWTAAVLIAATFAMSLLSWRFIERPFRRPMAMGGRAVRAILSASAIIVMIGLGLVATSGVGARIPDSIRGMESLEAMWRWDCPRHQAIADWGNACQFGAAWDQAAPKAFLWGDSHAEHIAPLLESVSGAAGYVLARTCPAFVDTTFVVEHDNDPGYADTCARYKAVAIKYLKNNPDISLVVLAASWTPLLDHLHRGGQPIGSRADTLELMVAGLRALIEEIAAPGRRIVLVTDVPIFPGSGASLCSAPDPKIIQRQACSVDTRGLSRDQFMSSQGVVVAAFEQFAHNLPGVSVVPTGPAMCESGECITVLEGEFLYRDQGHIRRNLRPETTLALTRLLGLDLL